MKTISNSFNLLLNQTYHLTKEISVCKILLKNHGDSPHKSISLLKRNKLYVYTTDTIDFSEEELYFTKYEKEQIYIQQGTNEKITDFRKQLKKLKIHRLCNNCFYKFSCTNIWQIERKNLFFRSEKYLHKFIRELRGKVLDIGCGSINLYKKFLKRLLKNNKITYIGIDNSKKEIEKMMKIYKDFKNAKFYPISVEDFKFDIYDNILLLRSINHIRNTDFLIKKCLKFLKKGGRLIMADNIAFGLIRSYNFKFKKTKKSKLEHFHNLDSYDIIRIVSRLRTSKPLKLLFSNSINKHSANQWIIVYEKL